MLAVASNTARRLAASGKTVDASLLAVRASGRGLRVDREHDACDGREEICWLHGSLGSGCSELLRAWRGKTAGGLATSRAYQRSSAIILFKKSKANHQRPENWPFLRQKWIERSQSSPRIRKVYYTLRNSGSPFNLASRLCRHGAQPGGSQPALLILTDNHNQRVFLRRRWPTEHRFSPTRGLP